MSADPNDTTQLQQSFNRRSCFYHTKEMERRLAVANHEKTEHEVPYPFPRDDNALTIEPEDVLLIKTGARQPPAAADVFSVISGAFVPRSVYMREYGSTTEEKAIRALYKMYTPYGIASKLTEYSTQHGLVTVDPPVADLSGIKHPVNLTSKVITTGTLLRAVFPRSHTLKERPTDRLKNKSRVTAVLEPFSLDLLYPNAASLRSVFDLGTNHKAPAQKVSDKYEEAPHLDEERKQFLYNALVAITLWEKFQRGAAAALQGEIETFCGFGHVNPADVPHASADFARTRLQDSTLTEYSSSRLLLHYMLGVPAGKHHICESTDHDVNNLNRSGPDCVLSYREAALRHAGLWTFGTAESNAEPGSAFDLGMKYQSHSG